MQELADLRAELDVKDAKLAPALVPGVNNRFLDSLVKGEIENFGSHFQDGPYGDGSIGDEKARWWERYIRLTRCRTRLRNPHSELRTNCPSMWRWENWITWKLWASATTSPQRRSGTSC